VAGITWWTAERVARLRRLAGEGLQAPAIARRLSRGRRITPSAVRCILPRN